jgi:hypothetical protein
MSKRGRPKTRSDEAKMFALWRLVREEIDLRGAKGVRKACAQIMSRGAINFKDFDEMGQGHVADRVSAESEKAASPLGELLRQRFQKAEEARKDAEQYPILSAKTLQYFEGIFALRVRAAHYAAVYKKMAEDGYARDGSTLPETDKKQLAIEGIYRPRKPKTKLT